MMPLKLLSIITLFGLLQDVFATESARPSKDYALFFAAEQYKNLDRLKNPISDARKLAQKQAEEYEFEVEIVENPNRKTIKAKLEQYRDLFDQGDLDKEGQLLIFFTGHGIFEKESANGFFIPTDGEVDDLQATAIPYSYWRPFIDRIDCRHILVAIDACYSGTFDQRVTMKSVDTKIDPVFQRPKELSEKERLIQNHDEHRTRLYLASSAIEKTPDRSQFSKQFFKALDEGGNRDGLLTAGEVFELYLKSVRPTPIFGDFGRDEAGSNFLFFAKEREEVVGVSKKEKDRLDAYQSEIALWEKAQQEKTMIAYQDYLQAYPDGSFSTPAQAELERLGAEYIMTGNELFDKRDGNKYQTMTIEGKIWMTQNLNFKVLDSYCYNNQESYCNQYGRLYTWKAALQVCPKGWHLPSDEEWKQLDKRHEELRSYQLPNVL